MYTLKLLTYMVDDISNKKNFIVMRYLVKAKVKEEKRRELKQAIDNATLGKGSVAGSEYIRDMKNARLLEDGTAAWVEVCFCNPPLAEERPYWEEYFQLLNTTDAANRKNCKHETGVKLWSCVNCNCTAKQEKEMENLGDSFYKSL
jgi:hypothetical protein